VRWASHHLGWTTVPGLVGHSPMPMRPKSLEFQHFLGIQTVKNPFFMGKYNFGFVCKFQWTGVALSLNFEFLVVFVKWFVSFII
jgi:hypothetical protein